MNRILQIREFNDFDVAFGDLGMKVGPRIGSNKRTNLNKEWYVIRRFLKSSIAIGLFSPPLSIRPGEPPEEPDFVLKWNENSVAIEITEATAEADQKEMTGFEKSGISAALLGSMGGRSERKLGSPENAWAVDVINAIERKVRKLICQLSDAGRHIVVYPNSNASFLLFGSDDERSAVESFKKIVTGKKSELSDAVNGCSIHILGSHFLFVDVLGCARECARID